MKPSPLSPLARLKALVAPPEDASPLARLRLQMRGSPASHGAAAARTLVPASRGDSAIHEWGTGPDVVVDRRDLAHFTHIIRGPDDPERSDIRKLPASLRDRTAEWRRKMKTSSVGDWGRAIWTLLSDGVPRTFNRIGVELADKTADLLLDLPPDRALWALVAEGRIEHTMHAPILFRARAGAAPPGADWEPVADAEDEDVGEEDPQADRFFAEAERALPPRAAVGGAATALDPPQSSPAGAAVCPRCLDIEPGKPGGTPDAPHPGPFMPGLCPACILAAAAPAGREAEGASPPSEEGGSIVRYVGAQHPHLAGLEGQVTAIHRGAAGDAHTVRWRQRGGGLWPPDPRDPATYHEHELKVLRGFSRAFAGIESRAARVARLDDELVGLADGAEPVTVQLAGGVHRGAEVLASPSSGGGVSAVHYVIKSGANAQAQRLGPEWDVITATSGRAWYVRRKSALAPALAPAPAPTSEPAAASAAPAGSGTAPLRVGRADYDDRRRARIDRLHGAADARFAQAEAAWQRSEDLAQRFEGGQPILVGHHSEKGARRDQERMHAAMSKSVAEQDRGQDLLGRAHAAETNRSISSDDPDALDRIRAEIAKRERQQALWKAINKAIRATTKVWQPKVEAVLRDHAAERAAFDQQLKAIERTLDSYYEPNNAGRRQEIKALKRQRSQPELEIRWQWGAAALEKSRADFMALGPIGDEADLIVTLASYTAPDDFNRIGVPPFELTNNAGQIRRLEGRLKELGASAQRAEREPVTFGGDVEVREDRDLNRVQIVFPGRVSRDAYDKLTGRGFKRAPSAEDGGRYVFQRLANDSAWSAALYLAREIAGAGAE